MMTKPTSEQVTFLASGSGAVQRTALDKFREIVSVKDFGAVGDGVTDDTVAIQAAINWHKTLPSTTKGGVKISLAGATYVVNGVIMTQDNNGLTFGDGKLVRTTGTGPGLNDVVQIRQEASSSVAVDGITIENIDIVGSAQYTRDDPSATADDAVNLTNFQWCNGIGAFSFQTDPALRGIRNVAVCNARISGMGKSAVVISDPENCIVDTLFVSRCCDHSVGVNAPSSNPQLTTFSVTVSNVVVDDSATLFDLSTPKPESGLFDPRYAIANISNVFGRTIRGRTKIHGPWTANITNLSVNNELILPANRIWPALDIPSPYAGNVSVSNMFAAYMSAGLKAEPQTFASILSVHGMSLYRCAFGFSTSFKFQFAHGIAMDGVAQPALVGGEVFCMDGFVLSNANAEYFNSVGTTAVSLGAYPIQIVSSKQIELANGKISGIGSSSAYTVPPSTTPFPRAIFAFGDSNANIRISHVTVEDPLANVGSRVFRFDSTGTVTYDSVTCAAGTSSAFAIGKNVSGGTLLVRDCTLLTPNAISSSDGFAGTFQKIGTFAVAYLSAAPVSGTWNRGDIIWNSAPSAGGTPGWVCTASGTPGTWKAMANVAA